MISNPPSPTLPEITQAFKNKPINLNALLSGGNPFEEAVVDEAFVSDIYNQSMDLQLATTQDMNDAIKSIGSFMKYLTEQSGENPDKVYIFLHTLRKATEELEKQAKKASELRQETY